MRTLHILILGDLNDRSVVAARDALRDQQFEVVLESDHKNLAAMLQEREPFDVCCIDHRFGPQEDGIVFAATVQALSPNSLIIVFTADNDLDAGLRAYRAGVYYFMPKPIRTDILQHIIWQIGEDRQLRCAYEQQIAAFVQATQQARSTEQVAQLIVRYGVALGFRRARLWRYMNFGYWGQLYGVTQYGNQGLDERFNGYQDTLNRKDTYLSRILKGNETDPLFFPGRKPGEAAFDKEFAPAFQPPSGPWLELPIRLWHEDHQDIWGVLTLDHDQDVSQWSTLHALRPALSLFGQLAGIAIYQAGAKENALSEDAHKLEQLTYKIAQDKEEGRDLDETVLTILIGLQRLFYDLAISPFVLTYEEDQDGKGSLVFTKESLEHFYHINVGSKERHAVKMDDDDEHSIVGRVARHSRSTGMAAAETVGDVRADKDYLPLIAETQSEVCLTLVSGGQLLGAIAIESPTKNAFTSTDVEVLLQVAAPISTAIQRAQGKGAAGAQAKTLKSITCSCNVVWLSGSPADLAEIFLADAQSAHLIDDLLKELFSEARQLEVKIIEVVSKPTRSKHQGIVRLRVREDTKSEVLVKVGLAQRIAQEQSHYIKYIQGAELVDEKACAKYVNWANGEHQLSAAIYKFPETSIESLPKFNDYYSIAEARSIIESLQAFFRQSWRYYLRQIQPDTPSLFQQYCRVWGSTRWIERLLTYPEKHAALDQDWLIANHVPDPVLWVREHVGLLDDADPDQSIYQEAVYAITHGDFRSDNLFIDTAPTIKAIRIGDYKRTGEGPILQDFVELEVDILLRLTCSKQDDLATVYDLLVAVTQNQTLNQPLQLPNEQAAIGNDINKALMVLSELRRLAFEVTHTTDIRHYLWGMLLNTAYVTLLLHEQGDDEDVWLRRRAKFLGGLLCRQLERTTATVNEVVVESFPSLPQATVIILTEYFNNMDRMITTLVPENTDIQWRLKRLTQAQILRLRDVLNTAPTDYQQPAIEVAKTLDTLIEQALTTSSHSKVSEDAGVEFQQAIGSIVKVLPNMAAIGKLLANTIWSLQSYSHSQGAAARAEEDLRPEHQSAINQKLRKALFNAFDPPSMELLTSDLASLNYRFSRVAPAEMGDTYEYRLLKLIDQARMNDWLCDLIMAAHKRKPKDAQIAEIVRELGLTVIGTGPELDGQPPATDR